MKSLKIFALVSILLLLTACSDNETPQPTPTPVNTPTLAPALTPVVTAIAEPTATTDAADPGQSLPPPQTLSLNTPIPIGTPTPTPIYGALPTPPRGLTAAPVTPENKPAFARNNFIVATNGGLFLLGANGKDEVTLASGTAFSEPQVAPDGSRIAVFRSDPINLQKTLVLVSPNGALKPVLGDGGTILNAVWSPDNKSLALTRVTDTNNDGVADANDIPDIWLYEVATDKQRKLSDGRNPAWSPDGVRLAFTIPGPYNDDMDPATRKPRRSPNTLAVYNLQTNAKRMLLDTKKLDITLPNTMEENLRGQVASVRYFNEVAWNPDGKRITVSADASTKKGATGLVLTVTLDDTNPKLVSAGGDAAGRVAWSGDGRRLAFEVEPQYPVRPTSANRIVLVDKADSGTALPPTLYLGQPSIPGETRRPVWINGGQQLAFLQGDSGTLVVVNGDGSNEQRLVSGCVGLAWLG